MIYVQLFYEFFKIGLFAVGGGMATIPFLQRLSESSGWYPPSLITDMIAISESTPGPIGINMATYVGYNVAGIPGGIIASLGVICPALIIVTLVSRSLAAFRSSKQVGQMFYGLRPAVTGLIMAAGFSVVQVALFTGNAYTGPASVLGMIAWHKVAYCALVYVAVVKFKKHPAVYITVSAVAGILLQF